MTFTRARIPGVRRDGEDGLVAAKDVAAVSRIRAAGQRRGGARTLAQKHEDSELRALGVPVFDRNAGQAELGGYLARGSRRD